MNSHEIKLASIQSLEKEKKNIKGYIKDWEDSLDEIETELRNREHDYTCY